MLLTAFAVLISAGLWAAVKSIVKSVLDYFSLEQRVKRRLWFVLAKQERIERLFFFKTVQIKYFNELNRKRLLKRNNRKHIKLLAASISKDLLLVKARLPETIYLQLQKDNVRYRKQQDVEALLRLQQKISNIG